MVDTVESMRLETTWIERCEYVWEEKRSSNKSLSLSGKLPAAIDLGVEAKASLQRDLRNMMSITAENKQTFEKTMAVSIPAGRVATVTIHWKQVWEETDFEIEVGGGATLMVPGRKAVKMIFDDVIRHD
jgi:hypothetical protein